MSSASHENVVPLADSSEQRERQRGTLHRTFASVWKDYPSEADRKAGRHTARRGSRPAVPSGVQRSTAALFSFMRYFVLYPVHHLSLFQHSPKINTTIYSIIVPKSVLSSGDFFQKNGLFVQSQNLVCFLLLYAILQRNEYNTYQSNLSPFEFFTMIIKYVKEWKRTAKKTSLDRD
jgi:hypothetical protein